MVNSGIMTVGKIDTWFFKVRSYVPFTSLNTVLRKFNKKARSVLDVGCGKGQPARALKRKTPVLIVGVDAFLPYLLMCLKNRSHDALILGDVRRLPFTKKSFDVVLCLEVVEHVDKEDAYRLIEDMERIARCQVILSIPTGQYEQHEYDGNPLQEHRSVWSPAELRELGYKVYGHGHKVVRGKIEFQSRFPSFLKPLLYAVWVLSGPFVYFMPEWSSDLVCVKELEA